MRTIFFALVICLCQGLAADPNTVALRAQADAAQQQGLPHLGAFALERAVAAAPSDIQVLAASARLLTKTGHPRLAIQRWQQVLSVDGGNAEAAQALKLLGAPTVLPTPGTSSAMPGEASQGLWLDGDIRNCVKTLNAYNLKAPLKQRLAEIYVASGQLLIKRGHTAWAVDLRPLQMAADTLQGDTRVDLWVQIDARAAKSLGDQDYEMLAEKLAEFLKDEKRAGGLVLEPHPASAALYPLYTALRKALPQLPLSVVVGSATADDFRYADTVILRAWPDKESLEHYVSRATDEIAAFLRAGEAATAGKAKVALGGNLSFPGKATPYFEAGRTALGQGLSNAGASYPGSCYLGYSVHGLLPNADDSQTDFEAPIWDLLTLPVVVP